MRKLILASAAVAAMCAPAAADSQSDNVKAVAIYYVSEKLCGFSAPQYEWQAAMRGAMEGQTYDQALNQATVAAGMMFRKFEAEPDLVLKFCAEVGVLFGILK